MKWKRKGKQTLAIMLAEATLLSGRAPNGIYAGEEPLLYCRHSVNSVHFSLDFIGFQGLKKVRSRLSLFCERHPLKQWISLFPL